MPEKEITEEQIKNVRKWAYDKEDCHFKRQLLPNTSNGLWRINNEPLAIYSEIKTTINESAGTVHAAEVRILLCSNAHAKDLEADGVINFSEKEDHIRTS